MSWYVAASLTEHATKHWFWAAYGVRCDVPDNSISQKLHEAMRIFISVAPPGGKLPLEYFPWLKYVLGVPTFGIY